MSRNPKREGPGCSADESGLRYGGIKYSLGMYEQLGSICGKQGSNIEIIPILTARPCHHGGFKGLLRRASARATNGPVLQGDLRSDEYQ